MARVTLLSEEAMGAAAKELFSSLPAKLNIFRTMAHAETTFPSQLRLGSAILSRQTLGHLERELLVLLVASLEGGEYEWHQHVPIARAVGISTSQIEAIQSEELTGDIFSDREKSLLAFGRQVVVDVRVQDDVFEHVRQYFTEQEVVEAILAIGFYMTMARLTEVAQTELDAADGVKAFNFLKSPDS